jgi:alpha-glucosidase (family GH31 glycosyl hydrolase)
MDLVPYFAALVRDAAATGAPVVRAPGLMHAGHPYEDDFYVGDALFAAPVVEAGAVTRTVTLPPGEWIDWWSGASVQGAQQADAPLDRLPLWRAVDRMVPMMANPIDTLLPDPGTFPLRVLLTPRQGAHFLLADGHVLDMSDDGNTITVSTDHPDVELDLDNIGWTPSSASCCYVDDNGVAKVHLVGGGMATLTR